MCVVLMALDAHPSYSLVVAANRDEFYARPTRPMHWWQEPPGLLAGRDLRSGGTWMGVTRAGRFAVVTNVREPGRTRRDAPSRGLLVTDVLTTHSSPPAFMERLADDGDRYNGFNLVAGTGGGLWAYSNRSRRPPVAIPPGVHGLSNALLDTPWPKVVGGVRELAASLGLGGAQLEDRLLEVLADRTTPPDRDLPDTGVGFDMERVLGSRFVVTTAYGTRASYVVLFGRDGVVRVTEQVFDHGEPAGEPHRFTFTVGS
jgi:uncharacterized protein with NRDE domain